MRRGRRPGTSTSRDALLEAARRRFAAAGYDGTTLRSVATEAGVDPGLVSYFFGSKQNLFRQVLGWPFDPTEASQQIANAGPDAGRIGERLTRLFLQMW